VGEELFEPIDLYDFGRRAILAAKQTLAKPHQRSEENSLAKNTAKELERSSAEVYQVWKKKFCCWMKKEMSWYFQKVSKYHRITSKGESIRAVVKKVDMRNNTR
jgi:N utilization substance protein A